MNIFKKLFGSKPKPVPQINHDLLDLLDGLDSTNEAIRQTTILQHKNQKNLDELNREIDTLQKRIAENKNGGKGL